MEELIEKIRALKEAANAVILAHNYQPGEIQDLADIRGDSLGLSRQAAETDADVIVFCGVQFMAETAAILSPDKTVLLPEKAAGCPMADMITAEQLRELKSKHPKAVVVCYVNSSVEVKAESDYCCTSSNAVEVVSSLGPEKEIIFVPDQHLGRFVEERTGRELILWPGYCPSHAVITVEGIEAARKEHPGAVVISHPECREAVKEVSDALLSTGQMLKFVKKSEASSFIVGTESGMIHALRKVRPDAEFVAASSRAVCPNMKKITVEKIITSLEQMRYKVIVEESVAARARQALERMIGILPEK